MFRSILAAVIAISILAGAAAAQGTFGLGIIVGEPTGISAKWWLSERSAIDAAAAWSFSDDSAMTLVADYLLHNFDLINVEKGQLPIYFGVGGRVKFESDSKVGIRIPVGLAYIFDGMPLDAFFEIAPLLDLIPDTEFNVNAAIGIRYFFGG
ncbi:MAG: hypothetical protein JSW50_09590 [Candidatus Latescibacterota bacterium]|nr:MAG: hypothetical protein JSW50_09590 [Candidatus Latescibacterota bacterium]